MARTLYLRTAACFLIILCLSVSAEEKKDRESKKRVDDAVGQGAKGKEKQGEALAEKPQKPAVLSTDVEAFRNRKDPAAVEIVTLYDEIDKCYTELATAMNVAAGEDKEARKAEREVKTYQGRIKRQLRKLETAVDKYTRPFDKDYEESKSKYDALRAKGDQLAEQGQDKKATTLYQQADRLTGKMEAAKRQLDVARYFLYFDSAAAVGDLGGGDEGGKEGKEGREGRKEREKGGKDRM